MTAQIDAVQAALHVDMTDEMSVGAAQLDASRVLTDMMTITIDTALKVPSAPSASDAIQQKILGQAGDNEYISGDSNKPISPIDEVMNVATRAAEIYADLTSFQVAWGIAKKSGKDIETLLKGQ